jgi:4-hydroxybenzoate polyprenyltransferase
MGVNRVVDARIDGDNPRTRMREIPTGRISSTAAVVFIAISSGIFLLASAMLGRLCFYVAVPILVILFSYSYAKRITWFTHLYLGFAISLAPWGAWVALTKTFFGPIWLLSLALLTYIAGFDILYACQDIDFDRKAGLFSIPARFGARQAMKIATALHVVAFIAFAAMFPVFQMDGAFLVTVFIIGILLIIEHLIVSPDDLSQMNVAFFHMNSLVSVVLFLGVMADEVLRRLV